MSGVIKARRADDVGGCVYQLVLCELVFDSNTVSDSEFSSSYSSERSDTYVYYSRAINGGNSVLL